MLEQAVPHDALAAHEAGHVVAALHLGVRPRGVRLTARGTSPAGTKFDSEELAGVTGAPRKLLAFAGLAGQIFAGTCWSHVHVRGDVKWLLADEQGAVAEDVGGSAVLRQHAVLFDHVRGELENALVAGTGYIAMEDLLRHAPK